MFDLSRVWLVAKRELTSRMKQRSYRITTIVQILIFVAAACLPTVIAAFNDDDGEVDTVSVLVVDETGSGYGDRIAQLVAFEVPGQPVIEIRSEDGTAATMAAMVDDGEADAGLAIARDPSSQQLAFTYVNDEGDTDVLAQRVYAAAQSLTAEDRLAALGVNEQEFQQAMAAPAFSVNAIASDGDEQSDAEEGARYLLAYVFATVAYMAVMLYGNWVSQGVVEEKSSRIMEIMINAATPRDLLFGKVIGIGLAAMLQLFPAIILGGLALSLQGRIADRLDIASTSFLEIDLSALSLETGGWFIIYFLLGFTLYAALFAAVGSLVSRQEEVSQAIAPLTTLLVGGFFGAIVTLSAPDSMLARVLAIIPLTSPTAMVPRVVLGDPATWEIALSLALLIVADLLALMVAARIYRVGVLMYGQKPKLWSVFRSSAPEVSR